MTNPSTEQKDNNENAVTEISATKYAGIYYDVVLDKAVRDCQGFDYCSVEKEQNAQARASFVSAYVTSIGKEFTPETKRKIKDTISTSITLSSNARIGNHQREYTATKEAVAHILTEGVEAAHKEEVLPSVSEAINAYKIQQLQQEAEMSERLAASMQLTAASNAKVLASTQELEKIAPDVIARTEQALKMAQELGEIEDRNDQRRLAAARELAELDQAREAMRQKQNFFGRNYKSITIGLGLAMTTALGYIGYEIRQGNQNNQQATETVSTNTKVSTDRIQAGLDKLGLETRSASADLKAEVAHLNSNVAAGQVYAAEGIKSTLRYEGQKTREWILLTHQAQQRAMMRRPVIQVVDSAGLNRLVR